MKKLILSTLMLAATLTMSAIPAKREWRTVSQSDGTKVTLMLVGDENFHCYQTTDGVPVIEENGNYYYANAIGNYLQKTDMLAHDAEMRSFQESQAIAQFGNEEDINRMWKAAPNMQHLRHKTIGTPTGDFHGSKKGIIILVSFNDIDFTVENPLQTFTDLANKEGYTNSYGAVGSVHDYFKDMSRGAFDLTFDVVGPYKAPQNASYYGENGMYGSDKNVRQLIIWAMKEADKDVNYKDYDWDNDGEVDQVFVLYAGYAEAQGAPSWTIWPHESQLGMSSFRADGVTLNTYACGQELEGTSGGRLAGLGTICHEFTHCLGLPDFYDTNKNNGTSNGNYGMGDWDLMCSGNYNGNSWIPAAYTAYERNFCGWFDFDELKETDQCVVSNMQPLENGGNAFIVYNPANKNEYYIFENRSRKYGWDRGVAGQGLLIYHINYNATRWRNNTVNSTGYGNPCMQVVPADNSFGYYDVGKDLWPSTQGITIINQFNENTTPSASLFNNNTDGTKKLHIDLNKIKVKSSTGVVSFIYNDGTEDFVPTGIKEINNAKNNASVGIYSLNGTRIMSTDNIENAQLQRGIYIVKSADGTTKKVRID
jgi:M6 family metalloprotease-like protein